MPYEVRRQDGGYKAFKKGTQTAYSEKPLSKAKAQAQVRAIYANTQNESANHLRDFGMRVDRILAEEMPDFIREKIESKKNKGKKPEKDDKEECDKDEDCDK